MTKKIKTIECDPMDLIPYDKNPRKNEKAIEEVAKSINKHGFVQPVLVDQHMRICIGHTRTEAAKWLGLKKIPVMQKDMTDQEFIQLNIEDNKTGEIADWDNDVLRDLVLELDDHGVDDLLAGFTDKDFNILLEDPDEVAPKKKRKDGTSTNLSEEAVDLGNTRKVIFVYTTKEHLVVDQKLDAIMNENKLESQAQALLFALKNFKGNPKVKRVTKAKTTTLKKTPKKKKAKKKGSKK